MESDSRPAQSVDDEATSYEPPAVVYVGRVADVTRQKEVGAADGATFLGLDVGSV